MLTSHFLSPPFSDDSLSLHSKCLLSRPDSFWLPGISRVGSLLKLSRLFTTSGLFLRPTLCAPPELHRRSCLPLLSPSCFPLRLPDLSTLGYVTSRVAIDITSLKQSYTQWLCSLSLPHSDLTSHKRLVSVDHQEDIAISP